VAKETDVGSGDHRDMSGPIRSYLRRRVRYEKVKLKVSISPSVSLQGTDALPRALNSKHQEGLYAAADETPASYSYPSTNFHNSTFISRPTPTSLIAQSAEPSPSSTVILHPLGRVPRDIGAAREAGRLLLWDLRDAGALWSSIERGVWTKCPDRQFLFAPVSVTTGEHTQTAVSVDALSGRIVYMHFVNGQWGNWQELEFNAQFLRLPAVFSRAPGRVDIINVDSDNHVWIVSYDGSIWGTWTKIGSGITSDVVATSSDENRIDVFGKTGDNVLHTFWTPESGWVEHWEDLGDATEGCYRETETSSPLAASWRDEGGDIIIDILIQWQGTNHKRYTNGAWSEWITGLASHEGYEFIDTQSLVKSDGVDGRPFAHMISQGTNNCIHYNSFNGTDWGSWNYIWCIEMEYWSADHRYPTEFMPTFALRGAGAAVNILVRDMRGNFIHMEVQGPMDRHEPWSIDNWQSFGQPA
jgi:hypothetical protein